MIKYTLSVHHTLVTYVTKLNFFKKRILIKKRQKRLRPDLPHGNYFPLGICETNDRFISIPSIWKCGITERLTL